MSLLPVTDADLGLPDDPIAQEKAERTIRAAIAVRLREGRDAAPATSLARWQAMDQALPSPMVSQVQGVAVPAVPLDALEVPDDALRFVAPTDTLTPIQAEITNQLGGLAAMPTARWLACQT